MKFYKVKLNVAKQISLITAVGYLENNDDS